MPDEETSYKNKKIIVRTEGGKSSLFIDNEKIKTSFDDEAKNYLTPLLLYRNFPTLVELAKAIIDDEG